MPSTVLYSAALNNAPNKVLVSDADVSEESTGIIKAGITYVCKGADFSQVSRGMILDSEPPAYPEIVFRDQIVQNRLFQQSRTVETQYGIGKIRAYYVGVLARGQNGNIENETETFSIEFPVSINDIITFTGNSNIYNIAAQEGVAGAWEYNQAQGRSDLAVFSISGRVTVQRTRFGAVINTPGALQALTKPTIDQLIVQATTTVSIGSFASRVLRRVFGIANGIDLDRGLAEAYTPSDWLKAFPNNWTLTAEISNEVLTPSVIIVNTTNRFVVTNESPPALMTMPPTDSPFYSADLPSLA